MSFLDNLPNPFSKNDQHSEYFFALNISQKKLIGSVWGIEGKKIRLINTAESEYHTNEQLIQAANLCLDEALADFEPEPEKLLVGVPDSWLQDEELKPEFMTLLKKMVKELGVIPMAYVSTTHAICHLLHKQQGVPVSAVLVEITDPLVITVVKAGKVLSSKTQKRTENLPQDIEKALLSVSDVEVLPSKIIIYGEKNLNKYKEELLSFSWMSQLPFLHLPKIENLEDQIEIKAACFAGATETNPDISFSPSDLYLDSNKHELRSNLIKPMAADMSPKSDLGFIAGDIEEESPLMEEEFDEDEAAFAPRETSVARRGGEEPGGFTVNTGPTSKFSKFKAMVLSPFKSFNASGFRRHGFIGGLIANKFLVLPVVLLLVLIAAFIFLPKAKVTVFIDMRTLEKDAQVIADPKITAVDEAAKKIPGKIVDTQENGSGKASATGKKQVGDPAKGSVVIYNKTSSPKTFSAGTVLTGPNNINFTLDSTVNIASQSALVGGISFGKSSPVGVTAQTIGPDGNLAAGKELGIKGVASSDSNAVVDQAFSGGVSKDVTVVTADDQKKLLASLISDLKKKARDDLTGKLPAGMVVLENGLTETVVKQTFSKNVGDQASEFTLNLTINLKGTSYSDAELKNIVSKLVSINVPEGYEIDLTRAETQADIAKVEKDGTLVFNAKFKAKLMPKLDKEKIRKEIAFKTPEEVAAKLKEIDNVIGSNIEMSPSLPSPLARLPLLSRNITIEVEAK